MTKPIPDGYHTITPYLIVKDAEKAVAFYAKAFGAAVKFANPGPDGTGMTHAELLIGNSIIMVGQECPQHGQKSVESLGASPVNMYLYVENVDEAMQTAIQAGGTLVMAVEEMFWGDRMGSVKDPFGYCWSIATHTKDLTPEEVHAGAQATYNQEQACHTNGTV